MNINSEYDKDEVGNSEEAMEACMSVISNLLIEPAMANDQLSADEAEVLGTVADALSIIAKKAYRYEKMLDTNNISPYTNN